MFCSDPTIISSELQFNILSINYSFSDQSLSRLSLHTSRKRHYLRERSLGRYIQELIRRIYILASCLNSFEGTNPFDYEGSIPEQCLSDNYISPASHGSHIGNHGYRTPRYIQVKHNQDAMSNLHRKVLESHDSRFLNPNKTISRKAASRQSSAASSRAGSKVNSRVNSALPSQQNSEDEYDSDDAATVFSRDTQLDDLLEDTTHQGDATWQQTLNERIQEILDRKRSSAGGRELAYSNYTRFLLANYCRDEIHDHTTNLVSAFLKSVKAPATEKEAVLACRALAITIVTDPESYMLGQILPTMKTVLVDAESMNLKALVISTVSITCFLVGSQDDTQNLMNFMLDILAADGSSIGASNESEVLTAAIHAWGILCTSLPDSVNRQSINDDAMGILVGLLKNLHVDVQVAAGECIALLYEMSYTSAEEDMEEEQIEYWRDRGKVLESDEDLLIQKYQPYDEEVDLLNTLARLTTGTKRKMAKKDRKHQHTSFQTIIKGVEYPLLSDGQPRQRLRRNRDSQLSVDAWWKLVRVHGLKRMLMGGWQIHLNQNDKFFRMLELTEEVPHDYRVVRAKPKGKKQTFQRAVIGAEEDDG